MSDNGASDQYARQHIEQIHATVDGLETNIATLDRRIDEWRRSTNTALAQIAQWDASDLAERRTRQGRLDHELRLLRWGVGIALLLLVVIISLFIGSQLK